MTDQDAMRESRCGRTLPRWAIVAPCATAVALACHPAAAEDLPSTNDWQFEFIPYLWAAGVRSYIKLGPLPGSTVSVNSSSILKELDFGAMGTLEARKGDWGGLLDLQYVKLGVSNQFAGGLLGGYNVK